jgi:hypothetical protein
MSSDDIKALYRAELKETVVIRRYTGTGANRPKFEAAVSGSSRRYRGTELIGNIVQGDQEILVLVEDLIKKKFALPVTANDKIVIAGKELAIIAANERADLDGTLIAYDLQARG